MIRCICRVYNPAIVSGSLPITAHDFDAKIQAKIPASHAERVLLPSVAPSAARVHTLHRLLSHRVMQNRLHAAARSFFNVTRDKLPAAMMWFCH